MNFEFCAQSHEFFILRAKQCIFHFARKSINFGFCAQNYNDFMLFLTWKLLKSVHFGVLEDFGQHLLTICVKNDQMNITSLLVSISSPILSNITSRNPKLITGGSKIKPLGYVKRKTKSRALDARSNS